VSLQRRLLTAERREPMSIVDLINVQSFGLACASIGFAIGFAFGKYTKK
jgi:hypothetical protein